ncbi:MAG: hybrid sensor histidine kinase/response regulator [Bacteroidia bacterium]
MSEFLDRINLTYINNEEDQHQNKHIFDLVSKEYEAINDKLQLKQNETKAVIKNLLSALGKKIENSETSTDLVQEDLVQLSHLVSKEIQLRKETEIELLEAKLIADNANLSKSNFLSLISHEIRNPLNIVIGLTHLLKKERHLDSQKEYINALSISSSNLKRLINDVLDFTKIEAHKIELISESFSLRDLITDLLNSNVAEARLKGLQFHCNLDEKVPDFLVGDKMRLNQVLSNLISNALKFTKSGKVILEVVQLGIKDNQSNLQISVQDTGIGMSSTSIASVFEDYTQADKTVSRDYGGTGLGLSISKRILDLMRSTLKVESTLGEGTRFHFNLTLPISKSSGESEKEIPISKQTNVNSNVLVVEDSEFNYLVVGSLLERIGVQSTHVRTGETAVELMQNNSYDLILMDIHMDGMDGFETSSRIREFDKHTPIYALSGSLNEENKAKCKEIGLNGFFSKPIDPDSFIETINDYLKNTLKSKGDVRK